MAEKFQWFDAAGEDVMDDVVVGVVSQGFYCRNCIADDRVVRRQVEIFGGVVVNDWIYFNRCSTDAMSDESCRTGSNS